MTPLVSILLASFVESIVSFTGGALAIFGVERIKRFTHFVVSFAVGALLGVSLLELIPEAIEMAGGASVFPWVLGGIIFFFIVEKFFSWYHHHGHEDEVRPYAYLILWGDFLHNFIDGVILALAFLADPKLGVITTLAVVLHEIPQEIGDFGVLMHAGFSPLRALFYNFLVSLSTIFGALLTYFLGAGLSPALPFALAFIAGNFLYLASTDLIPELHEKTHVWHSLGQIVLIVAGALLVILPEFLF